MQFFSKECEIKHLKVDEGKNRQLFYHTGTRFLAVRVSKTGHKSFVIQKRVGNKVIKRTFGKCGMMKLSTAIKLARHEINKLSQFNFSLKVYKYENNGFL